MPINNFMIATEPLGEQRARELIDGRFGVHDTRFVVDYFRLSDDHRLLFGGGENYRREFPPDIEKFVRPYMIKLFPQLKDVAIDYAWGGTLSVTVNRMPYIGRLRPNLFFGCGYSGHGISTANFAGKVIAEAIGGTTERFRCIQRSANAYVSRGNIAALSGNGRGYDVLLVQGPILTRFAQLIRLRQDITCQHHMTGFPLTKSARGVD